MAQSKVTTSAGGNPHIAQIYNVKNSDDCRNIYDDWASTFDEDLTGPAQEYVAPALVAKAVIAAGGNIAGEIFDAGCGTGLSGLALAQAGAKTIDGVDLSTGMLDVAVGKRIYRNLAPANLSKDIPDYPDGKYDVVTCVGTLTHGHVGPVPALWEFVRITKNGGIIAATVLDDIWTSGGYETEVEKLKEQSLVDVVGSESEWYRKGAGVKARILVLRKT